MKKKSVGAQIIQMWELKLHSQALLNSKILVFVLQLVFKLERFESPIGVSVFRVETRITGPIALKICKNVFPLVPHLSSKFEVSTLSHFEVIAIFSVSGYRKIVNFARKNKKTLNAKRRRSPNE